MVMPRFLLRSVMRRAAGAPIDPSWVTASEPPGRDVPCQTGPVPSVPCHPAGSSPSTWRPSPTRTSSPPSTASPTARTPTQLRRLLDERRSRSGGRTDFLPIPYHRPVVACTLEAEERDGALRVVDATAWTDRDGDEARLPAAHLAAHRRPHRWSPSTAGGSTSRCWRCAPSSWACLRRAGSREPAPRAPRTTSTSSICSPTAGRLPPPRSTSTPSWSGFPARRRWPGATCRSSTRPGALDRIAAYCMTDVVQTWLLFLRYRLVEGSLTRERLRGQRRLGAATTSPPSRGAACRRRRPGCSTAGWPGAPASSAIPHRRARRAERARRPEDTASG